VEHEKRKELAYMYTGGCCGVRIEEDTTTWRI
jgi:hypothetical protein